MGCLGHCKNLSVDNLCAAVERAVSIVWITRRALKSLLFLCLARFFYRKISVPPGTRDRALPRRENRLGSCHVRTP